MDAAPPSMRPDRGRRKRARRGVVLLDVILALAIIALGALVLVPIPRGEIGSAELRGEAMRVAAAFRQGRALALRNRGTVDISVDPRSGNVAYEGGADVAIRKGIELVWITSDQCPLSRGVRALRYLPDGRSCGGVLTLATRTAKIELRVDWLTGRVDMSTQ
jgi:general secretion pathway protein H